MSAVLRAAIIGCGPWGPQRGGVHSISYAHARSYANVPQRITIAAAASRNEKNVADFVNEFPSARPYRDYRLMLEEQRPDIVSVCAFPKDREAMVIDALRSGARIIWAEKPFAISIGSCDRMLAEAHLRGARIFVNFQRRFGKPFVAARDLLAGGRIGKLRSVTIMQCGGGILNFGPHLLDAALSCIGPRAPVRVIAAIDAHSSRRYQDYAEEEHFLASFHFTDDISLVYETGYAMIGGQSIISLQGSDGFIELHGGVPQGCASILRASLKGESAIFNPPMNDHFHHNENPNAYYDRALAEILRAWDSGTSSCIDASEAARGVEILVGACESARTGRIVEFPIANKEMPEIWR